MRKQNTLARALSVWTGPGLVEWPPVTRPRRAPRAVPQRTATALSRVTTLPPAVFVQVEVIGMTAD